MKMTQREVGILLNRITSVDGRRLVKGDPQTGLKGTPETWLEILDGLTFRDCEQAVIEHYRHSTEWLTPAHIRQRVDAIRGERIRAVGKNVNVGRRDAEDPREEIRVRRELTRALGDGTLTVDQYEAYHASGIRWDEWTGREIAA